MNEELDTELKKSYYAVIPANVRYDEELTPNAKLIYGEITALCNEKGYCWATNRYFAENFNVTKISVSKWINQLADKGYITVEIVYKNNTKEIDHRRITILGEVQKKTFSGSEENLNRGIKENFKDNNIYKNIKYNNIYNIKEKEKEKESKNEKLFREKITNYDFSDKLINKLNEWMKYKSEKKNTYTETGITNLLTQIKNNISKYSEEAIIELITSCMASNYQGIIFDKLQTNYVISDDELERIVNATFDKEK